VESVTGAGPATGSRHGAFARTLRKVLTHPLARGLDLDSPEATYIHGRLIREKRFLRRVYLHYYSHYDAAVARAARGGAVIEIGAGGGFFRETRRGVVTLDLRPGADVSVAGNASAMPFRAGAASAVLLLNVLHHLPDPAAFFRECARVLRPGGRVCMIEPFSSPLSRRIVRPLHHEPWDDSAGWTLRGAGPMSDANMAMPTSIFFRDRARYDADFPELPVDRLRLHTVFLYLLSGGVSMRSFLPGIAFGPVERTERLLAPAGRRLASMMTVELVRR